MLSNEEYAAKIIKEGKEAHDARMAERTLPKQSCGFCGRQGRPGQAFEGFVQDWDGRCPGCGYPYRGLFPGIEDSVSIEDSWQDTCQRRRRARLMETV